MHAHMPCLIRALTLASLARPILYTIHTQLPTLHQQAQMERLLSLKPKDRHPLAPHSTKAPPKARPEYEAYFLNMQHRLDNLEPQSIQYNLSRKEKQTLKEL